MKEVQELFSKGEVQEQAATMGANMPLRDFLLWTARTFQDQEEAPKFEHDSIAQSLFFLWLGKVLTDVNENGVWEEIELADGEIYINVPIFASFIRMLAKEYLKSRPSFEYVSDEGDVDNGAVARIANAIAEHYMGKWFSDDFEQGDVIQSFFFGETLYSVEYRDSLDALSAAEYEDAEEERSEDEEEDTVKLKTKSGKTAYKKGDVYFSGVSGFSWWSNSWAPTFDKTIWYREDIITDWSVIKKAYPNAMLNDGRSFGTEHRSLRQQRAIEKAQTGQQSGFFVGITAKAGDLYERERIYTREFLKPVVYEHYICEEDEKLPDGTVIKAGTKLTDAFPDGICFARVGKEILGLYNHDFHKSRVHCRFTVVPNRLHGKSVNDAAEIQYVINEVASLLVTYGMECGSPTIFYDEAIVPDGIGAGAKPSLRIPIGKRPHDVPLNNFFHIVPPGTLSPVIGQLLQTLKEDLQVVLGAFSPFGSGLPDAAGGTATGMALSAEAAASQQAMSLALRAQAKAKVLELLLEQYRDNVDIEQTLPIVGPYSEGEVVKFKGADICENLRVIVSKNSYWPRDIFQQQAQLMGYYQAKAAMYQQATFTSKLPTIAEEEYIAEIWMVDIARQIPRIAAEIAKERIDKAQDFLKRAQKDGTLLPLQEQQAILEAQQELLVAAVQQAQAEAAQQATLDDQGNVVQPSPDLDMAAESIDPDDILVEAANILVPMREEIDPHEQIAGYIKSQWALTTKGRNADPLVTKWVEQRYAKHNKLADADKASVMVGPQIAAQQQMQAVAPPPPADPSQQSSLAEAKQAAMQAGQMQ